MPSHSQALKRNFATRAVAVPGHRGRRCAPVAAVPAAANTAADPSSDGVRLQTDGDIRPRTAGGFVGIVMGILQQAHLHAAHTASGHFLPASTP